jgi:hypothetical protein
MPYLAIEVNVQTIEFSVISILKRLEMRYDVISPTQISDIKLKALLPYIHRIIELHDIESQIIIIIGSLSKIPTKEISYIFINDRNLKNNSIIKNFEKELLTAFSQMLARSAR